MKRIIFSILIAAISINSIAQLSLTGEFRPRGEFRHGYKQLADDSLRKDPAILVSQRSRLNLNYKADDYKIEFSVQDVRFWGDQIPKEDVASLAVYKAWLAYKIQDSLWVKLGRQELVFDNQRLLANGNWNQGGNTHDALRLDYNKSVNISFISAYNQNSDRLFGNHYLYYDKNYKLLNVLWLTKKINNFKLQLAGINDGYQKANTTAKIYMRYTYGGGIDASFNKFVIQGRGYLQSGKTNAGKEIVANYFSFILSDTLSKNLVLTAGFEQFSGNNATDTTNIRQHAFDPLYGSTHAYNGRLDYFGNVISITKGSGLRDIYLKANCKCCKNTTLLIDYHAFLLQNKYLVNNKEIDKYLGSEIDICTKFALSKVADLEIGYSYMFPTSSLETFVGGSKDVTSYWAYIMFILKPKFL
ncbi:MAG: hypothetical protein COX07_01640 [Bacteroidetes bacterium CG23_combo_of_CG06-09_8_20_14_all_32_9]|nr:MAG: hypothetical protein COX07_01640 [Bacteroidetes bacterium CG23_combo_of_CG06-09_8_20_14_all_32_9]